MKKETRKILNEYPNKKQIYVFNMEQFPPPTSSNFFNSLFTEKFCNGIIVLYILSRLCIFLITHTYSEIIRIIVYICVI